MAGVRGGVWVSWLEFVSVSLGHVSWPIAASIIAMFFRRELISLLPRITKLGPSGVELVAPQKVDLNNSDLQKAEISDVDIFDLHDPAAIDIEAANIRALDAVTKDPQQREKVLIRALTTQQMERNFALAYQGIFGSQIRFLKALNSTPLSRELAGKFFYDMRSLNPSLKEWDLDLFVRYLLNWRLINERSDGFEITLTGRNFLAFIVSQGLIEDRPN